MSFEIWYPEHGRGAWPSDGDGGTLNSSGSALGKYYRAPKKGAGMHRPGKTAYQAVLLEEPVSIDDYAVYKAVQGFQRWMGAPVTGMFDKVTREAVKEWQEEEGITADGIFGPQTARHLFEPVILSEAEKLDSSIADLGRVVVGHVTWESGFDPGAVGGASPEDLGLAQINGPSHPDMSVDQRLTPLPSIRWVVKFVDSNLNEFPGDLDAGIAAYNLGKGGTRSWISDGRPDVWTREINGEDVTTDVRRYINEIKKAAGLL